MSTKRFTSFLFLKTWTLRIVTLSVEREIRRLAVTISYHSFHYITGIRYVPVNKFVFLSKLG